MYFRSAETKQPCRFLVFGGVFLFVCWLGLVFLKIFLFLIGTKLNCVFVGPELKFGFILLRLLMDVEILAFHSQDRKGRSFD